MISEIQIHPLTKKPQSDCGCLGIISINLGWTDDHADEAFGITKVESAMLQEHKDNGSKSESEALVL